MTLWQRFFGERPLRPILLRLDLGGVRCPGEVVVEADWSPTRERSMARLITSSSMTLLPWRASSTRVSLVVRAAGRVGRVALSRTDLRDGAVIDLRLEEEHRIAS